MRTFTRGVRRWIAVLAVVGAAGGCAGVRPFQRENLARRAMMEDREPGEARVDEHARASREGADGGAGQAGGGCGCN